MKKIKICLLYVFCLLCSIINTSCSGEIMDEVDTMLNQESTDSFYDSIPKTRAGEVCHISAKGGTITTTCSVICKIKTWHTHNVLDGCKSSITPGSHGWCYVSILDFTRVSIAVTPNNSFVSRKMSISDTGSPLGGILIIQAGKLEDPYANVKWGEIKDQYKIDGPVGIPEDTDMTCKFYLSGPYLSTDIVKIYWSVRPHWNSVGSGTVVQGQGTSSVDIFFPFNSVYGCTGIVQARIEPKKNPSEGFAVEHKLAIR